MYTVNNIPSIYFSGNSWLPSVGPLAASSAFSVLAPTSYTYPANIEYTTGGASLAENVGLVAVRMSELERRVGLGAANSNFADPIKLGVLRQYTDELSPNSMRRNGGTATALSAGASWSGSVMSIGARDGSFPMIGHISEILFFKNKLTTPRRIDLENNQMNYYNIAML